MPTITSIVRDILKSDSSLATDQVMAKAVAKGAKTTPDKMRKIIYKAKAVMRKAGVKPSISAATASKTPMPEAPVAVREPAKVQPVETPSVATTNANDLSSVLANVALVNRVMGLCGGPENARQVAEAVRTCGGLKAFLQHLELVAGIRSGDSSR